MDNTNDHQNLSAVCVSHISTCPSSYRPSLESFWTVLVNFKALQVDDLSNVVF